MTIHSEGINPTDNEKLIAEAADAILWSSRGMDEPGVDWPADRADAARIVSAVLAVFEKAHTPTDDEREALIEDARRAAGALEEYEFEGVAGDASGLLNRLADLAAGFRRSEVPEPSAEAWSTEDRRNAEAEAKHRWYVEESRTRTSQRDFDNFNQGCINGFMLGAEWWKAMHPAAPKPQGEPSDAQEAVRRLKDSGVGAYMILAAVTKVYDMETKP